MWKFYGSPDGLVLPRFIEELPERHTPNAAQAPPTQLTCGRKIVVGLTTIVLCDVVISSVEEFSLSLDLPWNRPYDSSTYTFTPCFATWTRLRRLTLGIEISSQDVDVIHNMGWWMGSSISYRGIEELCDLRPSSHLTFAGILTNYPHYPTYTSNGLSWIIQNVEGYHGETVLRDTLHANIELLPVWEHALQPKVYDAGSGEVFS
ncbi:hypothetical protein HGRIS_012343 [Hohenbuehelia grisea]|uniref:Uncharacterized protein n=1 Tax=Hohenbuehelia grisea TaxID=104357 RepID=A0ABR3IRY6_9AGAR